MLAKVKTDPAWHRYEFNPDTPQPQLPTCPERPYAWRDTPPNPSIIERRGDELFLNGRRILIHEINPSADLTLAGVREQLIGHSMPDESVNMFLMKHKWLVPEPFMRRELIFFGSGRRYETCVTVSCLVVGQSIVSSRYCSIDEAWNHRHAALYLENAAL